MRLLQTQSSLVLLGFVAIFSGNRLLIVSFTINRYHIMCKLLKSKNVFCDADQTHFSRTYFPPLKLDAFAWSATEKNVSRERLYTYGLWDPYTNNVFSINLHKRWKLEMPKHWKQSHWVGHRMGFGLLMATSTRIHSIHNANSINALYFIFQIQTHPWDQTTHTILYHYYQLILIIFSLH